MTDWDSFWNQRNVHFPDEDLVRFLARTPRGHGIDLGCGTGRNGIAFQKFGHTVTGVDTSDVALKQAGQRGTYKTIFQSRVDDLPVLDNTYDMAADVCTFQHVENVGPCAEEAYRILKIGGLLFSKFTSRAIEDESLYKELDPTHLVYLDELKEWFKPLILESDEHHIIENGSGTVINAHWVTVWRKA